ncbi:ATP-binding cassette domain-containing protein [Flavobacteriaceae bacterium R38]|nr:ATP-binding cassette domain-containing protein [Flavobacteriaceae bacterium R38]
MSYLKIQHISKTFKNEPVLNDISFSLEKSKVLSILGKSGSGKTTLLKIIAGLIKEDTGKVILEGKSISKMPPNHRNIVYLYQEPLLFPHLNVFENIAFGLRLKNLPKMIINEQVTTMLSNINMEAHANKMPGELSGGQKQRVAFGRAIIIEPKVLLLDEPFGALDSETRDQMQILFKDLQQKKAITALFITHDLKESLIMGDQLGVITEKKLTLYASKQDFIDDESTGSKKEMDFWEKIYKS